MDNFIDSFLNFFNKAPKLWSQAELDFALYSDQNKLFKLLERPDIIEFSNEQFTPLSLMDLNIAFDKLKIKAIIGMKDLDIKRTENITSLMLPEGMKKLRKIWISNNKLLQSFTLPVGMTSLLGIYLLKNDSLQSITFPTDLVGLISIYLFSNNSLQSFTLPAGMVNLQCLTLNENTLLQSVTIPAGMTNLHTIDLNDCLSLQSVTLPEGMTKLRNIFLKDCNALQLVNLPNGMTNLQTIDLRFNALISREHVLQLRSQYPGVVLSDFDVSFAPINQQINVQGQEVLVQQRRFVSNAYINLATNGATEKLVTANLPTIETTKEKFINAAADMQTLLEQALAMNDLKFTDGQKFRLKTALRSLLLLKGNDDKIERHVTSSLESYANYAYHGLPNIRQIFVLSYNLLLGKAVELKTKEFIVAYLKQDREKEWKKVTGILKAKTIGYEEITIADTLVEELQKPNNAVDILYDLMTKPNLDTWHLSPNQIKVLCTKIRPEMIDIFTQAKKVFTPEILDKLNPLIEALFMIMRGHNKGLENSNEKNKPACAEGAYLNIMKVLGEIEQTKGVMKDISGIEVALCDGRTTSVG